MGTVLLAGFSAAAQEIQEEEHYYVSEEIIYRDIQGIEDVPQTVWILVKNPANGKRERRLFPLETVEYMDGFMKSLKWEKCSYVQSSIWRSGCQRECKSFIR